MPNDAKLGLVVGVGLVITVAVLFFHKEGSGGSASEPAPAGIVRPIPPAPLPSGSMRTASAHPVSRTSETPEPAGGRRHTVKQGDTLFNLARWYYGDSEKFGVIYQANRGVLREPDPLPVGVELVIPEQSTQEQNP